MTSRMAARPAMLPTMAPATTAVLGPPFPSSFAPASPDGTALLPSPPVELLDCPVELLTVLLSTDELDFIDRIELDVIVISLDVGESEDVGLSIGDDLSGAELDGISTELGPEGCQ